MDAYRKAEYRRLLLVLVAFHLFLLSGCSPPSNANDDLVSPGTIIVPDFSLTERSGKTITKADLHGKVWIASFVFTRCTGPCPQISGTVARLQNELEHEKDVRLVTFTVDPERDALGELKEYAEHFGADPERWLFLTGKKAEIHDLLNTGFKVGVVEQSQDDTRTPGNDITHSTRLVLVDRQGNVRGYFDGQQVDLQGNPVDDLPRLKKALKVILAEKP